MHICFKFGESEWIISSLAGKHEQKRCLPGHVWSLLPLVSLQPSHSNYQKRCFWASLTYLLGGFRRVLALQGFALTFRIHSNDPEVVLCALTQVWHGEVGGGAIHTASLGPCGPGVWSHLDDVRGQRGSSVTLRGIPLQVSRVLRHIADLKRTFGFARNVWRRKMTLEQLLCFQAKCNPTLRIKWIKIYIWCIQTLTWNNACWWCQVGTESNSSYNYKNIYTIIHSPKKSLVKSLKSHLFKFDSLCVWGGGGWMSASVRACMHAYMCVC